MWNSIFFFVLSCCSSYTKCLCFDCANSCDWQKWSGKKTVHYSRILFFHSITEIYRLHSLILIRVFVLKNKKKQQSNSNIEKKPRQYRTYKAVNVKCIWLGTEQPQKTLNGSVIPWNLKIKADYETMYRPNSRSTAATHKHMHARWRTHTQTHNMRIKKQRLSLSIP